MMRQLPIAEKQYYNVTKTKTRKYEIMMLYFLLAKVYSMTNCHVEQLILSGQISNQCFRVGL